MTGCRTSSQNDLSAALVVELRSKEVWGLPRGYSERGQYKTLLIRKMSETFTKDALGQAFVFMFPSKRWMAEGTSKVEARKLGPGRLR